MPRVIEIIISSTGETTVQTKGFTGSDCLEASRWLEQALGLALAERKTAEFYEREVTEQQIQQ